MGHLGAVSEPQISTLGGILTLGTPPADRSTADCPLLLTVASLSHSLALSAACSQAPTWLCERIYMMAQRRNGGLRGCLQARRPWRAVAGARRGRCRHRQPCVCRGADGRAPTSAEAYAAQIFARLRRALGECVCMRVPTRDFMVVAVSNDCE